MTLKHLLNLSPLSGDKLASLPILVLYITDGCNSRCVTCDIWRSPRRNMRLDLVDILVEDAAALGVRWVILSGGEAMQHPEWGTIADKFRAIGARIFMLTNGLLVRRQIQTVIDTVDELIVSLDGGTAATYEAIRGVDGFERVLEGITAARRAGKPVTTRTTVQRANFREIPQIIAAAKRADASKVSFLTVDVSSQFAFGPRFVSEALFDDMTGTAFETPDHHPPAAALTIEECAELELILAQVERDYSNDFLNGRIAESPAKLRRMTDYFRALLGQHETDAAVRAAHPFPPVLCNAPKTSAVVEVDGRVRPCYFLPSMGRVRLSEGVSLTDAINSDAAVTLRRQQRQGNRDECARCVCPLYKGARGLLAL